MFGSAGNISDDGLPANQSKAGENVRLPVHRSAEDVSRLHSLKSAPREPTLHDYLRIVYKHRFVVIATVALVMGSTALYVFLKQPLYSATAMLKVTFYVPALPGEVTEDTLSQQSRSDEYLNTLVQQINSPALARKVLADPQIAQALAQEQRSARDPFKFIKDAYGWLRARLLPAAHDEQGGNEQQDLRQVASYLGRLSVTPIFKTTLIQLEMTAADRKLSADLANAHARAFIARIRTEQQRVSKAKLAFLQRQAKELNSKVGSSEKLLAQYAEDHSIVDMNRDETVLLKQFTDLSQLLTETTTRRLKSEQALHEAQAGSGLEGASIDLKSISELRSSLKDAEAEYAQLGEKFQPAYPRMQQLKARIASLRSQALSAIRARFEAERGAEAKIESQLDDLRAKVFTLSKNQIRYNQMQAEHASLRDLRQAVLRQIEQARVGAESRETNVALSERAELPLFRSSPRRGFILIVAGIFGPLLGFVLALLLERVNTTFKHLDEVREHLGVPTLGLVPNTAAIEKLAPAGISRRRSRLEWLRLRRKPAAMAVPIAQVSEVPALREAQLVTVRAPRSSGAEAFRTVRTNILLSSADRPPKVILVTSAQKEEGKSTVAANLAVALAQSSGRTLLIDGDLRRPQLCRFFNLSAKRSGLVDFLTGQVELETVIVSTTLPNLFVMPAGSMAPDPADLVSSEKFAHLIHSLSQHFEYILLDSPPVLPVADALALSRLCDGVVMVVEAKRTAREYVRRAIADLRGVRAIILGVVLNRASSPTGDAYAEYRGHFSVNDDESIEIVDEAPPVANG